MNRQRPPTMDQQRTAAKTSGGSLTCRRRNRCFCIDRPEKYCLYGILDGILLNHLCIILFVMILFGFGTCSILPRITEGGSPSPRQGTAFFVWAAFSKAGKLSSPSLRTQHHQRKPRRQGPLTPGRDLRGRETGSALAIHHPCFVRRIPGAFPLPITASPAPRPEGSPLPRGRHHHQRSPPHRQGSTDIQNV